MTEPVSPERVTELFQGSSANRDEVRALAEELELHRAASRPCFCPDVSNTPHVMGCPHPLRVLQERDELIEESQKAKSRIAFWERHSEILRKQLDAVEAHSQLVKGNIVGCFKRIWENNEEIARLGSDEQKIRAEARARAFKEAMFAVEKIDFVKPKMKAESD